jgi:hypothetical protein
MREKSEERQQDNRHQDIPTHPLESPDPTLEGNVLIDGMTSVLHFLVVSIHRDGYPLRFGSAPFSE